MSVTRAIREHALLELLSNPCFKTGTWVCKTDKDPIRLGEYGRSELYIWEKIPVFRLEIQFNPPKTRAFITDNLKEILALDADTMEVNP